MAPRKPYLSKSRLISAWQCPKRAHLEKHRPELAVVPASTRALWATGHEVGAVAKDLFGTAGSVEIEFDRRTGLMLRQTADLLEQGAGFPIFEATFRHENVLVRVDVLIPGDDGYRIVEVKASTSLKPHHVLDCAIQDWVLRGAGLPVSSVSLAHIDNRFVYAGDGAFDGLLVEHDVSDALRLSENGVVELVATARDAVGGTMPEIEVGKQCTSPYECPFMSYCWPAGREYPVTDLGGSKAKQAEWVNRGFTDLRDIPAKEITAERQQRIHRVTVSGKSELLPGAAAIFDSLGYPRFYLDFETIGPAVPVWAGTRPYEPIPVQWSVHIDDGDGDGSLTSLRHEEFLDLSGDAPMRALVEGLLQTLGESGPVFMYTDYERQVIKRLGGRYPDLAVALTAIDERLFDLKKVVEAHYYDPSMRGSWSIKAVAPAIAPHRDYAHLDGINEGLAASAGFLEAIRPETAPQRRAELEEQLLRYCRFDTEAMVEIVAFLSAADTAAGNAPRRSP